MGPGLEYLDAARGALRAIVATIDLEMSRLCEPTRSEANSTTNELRSSWAAGTLVCVRPRAVATAGRSCRHPLSEPST